MTHSAPLVSVIMIFLNAERFLEEAIESVFAQTYRNWELLLVDDGSTDGSTGMAWGYVKQYPNRVRYLEHDGHQNRGMSASRNLGIRQARGEYIAFLDADDVYLPEKLARQVGILNTHPSAAMVYGATLHWYSWTGKAEDLQYERLRKLGVPTDKLIQPPTLVNLFLQHKAWTPGTCGVLVRRTAIEQVGGFEESFRGMFEDQVFFYKLCLSMTVFVESGSWDRYRQHPDSWSMASVNSGESRRDYRPNRARQTFLTWLEAYFIAQNITDRELWKNLRRELWPYRHSILYRLLTVAQRAKHILVDLNNSYFI
jgi:glycosyltransferase involved in cell wall biosynthesis